MRFINFSLILVLGALQLIFLLSCEESFEEEKMKEFEKKKLVLIYCDLSKSGSSEAVDRIAENVLGIFNIIPPTSEIHMYALNHPGGSELLGKYTKPSNYPNENVPSEVEKHNVLLKLYSTKLDTVIQDVIRSAYLADDGKSNSCILNIFDSAFDKFASKNGEDWGKDLFILSDLVEDCSSSISNRSLSINTKKRMRETSDYIQKEWGSRNKIDENINIYMIYTENTEVISKLSYSEIRGFWMEVLSKLLYNKDLYFSSDVPDSLD